MDTRLEELGMLRSGLEALISVVESTESYQAPARVQGECEAAFARFRRAHEERSREENEPPADVRQAMEDVQRLYVVALSLAGRHREELEQQLGKLTRARKVLRSARREDDAAKGGYCNLAG